MSRERFVTLQKPEHNTTSNTEINHDMTITLKTLHRSLSAFAPDERRSIVLKVNCLNYEDIALANKKKG